MYSFFGTWPWYVSGFLIGTIMLLLIYFGKSFGMSSNLRTLCTIAGAGKTASFFRFDWREQKWNLAVVIGAVLGGFVATHYLSDGSGVQLNPKTLAAISQLNLDTPNGNLAPKTLFDLKAVTTPKTFLILLFGGLLIGFGTRYAGGCTSGHAISGLSNLQKPSLIAVIGFFAGGLLMVHVILPLLFK